MNRKQFHRRVWGLIGSMILIFSILGSGLYQAQVVRGAEYVAQSQRKIPETEVVEVARGEILDRYGRVLVSNRVVYQVTINTKHMGKADDRNQTLSTLIDIALAEEVEWTDTLPISQTAPFEFTTDSPYTSTSTNEDGVESTVLTRLGKLALNMKWITGDPTDPDEGDVSLPSAPQLLEKMGESFDLTPDQTKSKDTSPMEQRALIGVLYEVYLRSRDVNWNPYIFAEEVNISFISKVKEEALPGVTIAPTTVRQYHTEYAAHLLGRVAQMSDSEWDHYSQLNDGYEFNDLVGKEGAELAFESYLRGEAGVRRIERNLEGKIMSSTWEVEPKPGDHVVLTLDIDLQKKTEDTLAEMVPKLKSRTTEGAACVLIDVNSGEVLSAASYPTYDLSKYGADLKKNEQDPRNPLFNRVTGGTYAPGSTFKMITGIAGLEEGIVAPHTTIRDAGVYDYYEDTGPSCWIYNQYRGSHGRQNISQAITNSCNYYFYDVGRQLGISRLSDYAAMFGLGEPTGIEVPEKIGAMAGPAYTEANGGTWYDGSTLSVAIGQESSNFTPIQMANYIATLVNGGTRYGVHLLKEVKSNDFSQIIYTQQPEALEVLNLELSNVESIKLGMLNLTKTGSVSRHFQTLRSMGIEAGGKTGSAQLTTSLSESNAVFVCFAPYDDPQVALAIVVEKGGTGGEVAGIAAEILEYYFTTQESRDEILRENMLIQ